MMVMDYFMHYASSKSSDDGSRRRSQEKDRLLRSPEVLLLCALASMKEPLHILCEQGGLEAIILVAHEKEPNALRALREVC